MNRRGYFAVLSLTGMMGMFLIILLILTFSSLQQGAEADLFQNITSNNLNWSNYNSAFLNGSENIVVDLAYRFVDFTGYAIFEISKLAIDWAVKNPNIVHWKTLFILLIILIVTPFIVALLKTAVIIFILIKDGIESFKEKKRLKALRKFREDEKK